MRAASLGAKDYVDGLVGESRKVFSGIVSIGESRLPARSERFVDRVDAAWHFETALNRYPATKRIEHCLDLDPGRIPSRYSPAIEKFQAILSALPAGKKGLPAQIRNSVTAVLCNYSDSYREKWKVPIRVQSALQAVIDDLYDSFLSSKDREILGKPDLPDAPRLPPPLTFISEGPAPFTQLTYFCGNPFDLYLVGYPRYLAKGGIAVWPALAHETCGHVILDAYPRLAGELRAAILASMEAELLANGFEGRDIEAIRTYWISRFNEAISDCLGILFAGPSLAYSMQARLVLENDYSLPGEAPEEHPSTLHRIYMAACAVGELDFDLPGKDMSTQLKRDLAERRRKLPVDNRAYWDLSMVDIRPERSRQAAEISAEIFARSALTARLPSLNNHCLGELQNWRDTDEELARRVARQMGGDDFTEEWKASPDQPLAYPAHLVAGAIMALPGKSGEAAEAVFENLLHAIHFAKLTGQPRNDYFEDLKQ